MYSLRQRIALRLLILAVAATLAVGVVLLSQWAVGYTQPVGVDRCSSDYGYVGDRPECK